MSNPFWDFSLALYADPEVQAASLALQDRAGCDVNLVLYGLYQARNGRTLDAAAFAGLDAMIKPVRDLAVVPLRSIRREMKKHGFAADSDGFERLRTEVKTVELHAEKLMQSLLASAQPATGEAEPITAARANLAAYGRSLGRDLPAAEANVLIVSLARMISAVDS